MERLPEVKMSQLRNFVAVVDEKGFKAAARTIFRSQAAISLSIKELENLLGATLFEQNTHIDLTPFGQQFYLAARDLLEHYNGTVRTAVNIANIRVGKVRVTAIPSMAREILPRTITRFIAMYPEIEIRVEDGHTQYVRDQVLGGNADFGCCGSIDADSRLNFTEVASDVMGVVCHRVHPIAQKREIDWSQLGEYTMISNGTFGLLDPALAQSITRHSKIHISNMTSLLAVIEANVGITVLPSLAYPHTAAEMCFIPLVNPVARRNVGILEMAMVSLNPAAAAFRSTLFEEMKSVLDRSSPGGAARRG